MKTTCILGVSEKERSRKQEILVRIKLNINGEISITTIKC